MGCLPHHTPLASPQSQLPTNPSAAEPADPPIPHIPPELRNRPDPIPTPHPNSCACSTNTGGDAVPPARLLPPRKTHHGRLRNLPSQLCRQNRPRQLPRLPPLGPPRPARVSGSHLPHLLPHLSHRTGANHHQARPHPRLFRLPRERTAAAHPRNSSLTARSAWSIATSV
jgi:hypothetical protein